MEEGETFPFMIDRGGVSSHVTGATASIYDLMVPGNGSGREASKKKKTSHKVMLENQ